MKYRGKIQLIAKWVPAILNDWLVEGLPVDMTIKSGQWKGVKMLEVTIEAETVESLEAKRRAFNTMIEAKGYGPEANKE